MKNFPQVGIQIPTTYLPVKNIDLTKWAVIACDQFTSQPEYWQKVQEEVGDYPSTFHLILPEVYLGTPEETRRIRSTQEAMRRYLDEKTIEPIEGLVLVEREVDGKRRRGLMVALDLEGYDFNKGSQSLTRATEGTIIERLPPRLRIRESALLESPHILVLIDDPEKTVIEPVTAARAALQPLYDFDLMAGSGRLRGYLVQDRALEERVVESLTRLANPQYFRQKYHVGAEKGVLLFAVGDGNHSLATAKMTWEKLKPHVGPEHPARYALVEVENVHDPGLAFEPIHRVLFQAAPDWKQAMTDFYQGKVAFQAAASQQEMIAAVKNQAGPAQVAGAISAQGVELVTFEAPSSNLSVGSLQAFLDHWIPAGGAQQIDYVHGDEVVSRLAQQPGNLGFYLPALDKNALFKTVILDGSLPRKTFSMGEAHEKRFYMECRKISPD